MRIIFAGTPDFAVRTLNSLQNSKHKIVAVYCQPDRPCGRGKVLSSCAVKQYAQQHNLKIFQPQNITNEDTLKQLIQHNADIIIVVAYGQILSKSIINQTKYGCLNIHGSLLPRWRGAAPIQRAIIAGDKKTGISIIKINEKLDSGDILFKKQCAINTNDNYEHIHNKLAQMGADTINKVIDNLENIKPIKQKENLVTYAKKINKEEIWINWNNSAFDIERMINAFNPRPIAKCRAQSLQFNNKSLGILKAKASKYYHNKNSGEVYDVDKNSCYIATGNGLLELQIVQLEGKKAVNIKDFNNAYTLQKLS